MKIDLSKYPEVCGDCGRPARSEAFDDGRLGTEVWQFCVNSKCWQYDVRWLRAVSLRKAPRYDKPLEIVPEPKRENAQPACTACGLPLASSVVGKSDGVYREYFCRNLNCPKSHELALRVKVEQVA